MNENLIMGERRLSQKPAAVRKRKSRSKRKSDFVCFQIYLPHEEVMLAVRRKEKIPFGKPVPDDTVERALSEGLAVWLGRWLGLPGGHA
jgi:hypothetical protein